MDLNICFIEFWVIVLKSYFMTLIAWFDVAVLVLKLSRPIVLFSLKIFLKHSVFYRNESAKQVRHFQSPFVHVPHVIICTILYVYFL